jgi:RHS repeat-associated protein
MVSPESATGLYAFLFRTYSPSLGRWLQRDPEEYVDGVNLYEYVHGDPLSYVDPLGLDAFEDCISDCAGELLAGSDPCLTVGGCADRCAPFWPAHELERLRREDELIKKRLAALEGLAHQQQAEKKAKEKAEREKSIIAIGDEVTIFTRHGVSIKARPRSLWYRIKWVGRLMVGEDSKFPWPQHKKKRGGMPYDPRNDEREKPPKMPYDPRDDDELEEGATPPSMLDPL